MSDRSSPSVVTINIAGEEYTLRAHASPEYTKECARYIDRLVREILSQQATMEPHRAVILAALSAADHLFQARNETQALRDELATAAGDLARTIDRSLPPPDLASPR